MVIYQADQYVIPFTIKHNNKIVTINDITNVKIAVGDIVRSYTEGNLAFDSTTSAWMFYVSKSETAKISGVVETQVEVEMTSEIYHSAIISTNVAKSMRVFLQGDK